MIDIWRILRPYVRNHRRLLWIAAAAMAGEIVTGLLTPWPLKFVFDAVLFTRSGGKTHVRSSVDSHVVTLLALISAAALLIAIFDATFTYIDDRMTTIVAQRSVDELRRALFAHLQRLSLSFHASVENQLGDLLSRLNGDIQALQDLAASGISNLVTNGLGVVTAFAIMLWLDLRLALVIAAFTVPMYIVARRTITQMRLALRTARRQEGRVAAVLQEALSAVKLVQAFGREDYEERRLATESKKSLDAGLEAAGLQSRLGPTLSVLSTVATVVVTAYGVVLVMNRSITPGVLLIFLGYLRGMQSPIRQLAKLSFAVGKASASVERLQDVLARQPDVIERPGALTLSHARGEVVFERVCFAYHSDRRVLSEVSLDVRAGQVVALVGRTGAGKSTLVSLLPRFYDPTSGHVLIDGVDLRDVTLESLRENVALVLQDTLIFRATLAENIAYGRPSATQAEIEAAGNAAEVDVLASRLSDGYGTLVSERGTSLSGGEKQCIGIARALLKDAPIVVLDEPTSAMDSLTEQRVMRGVEHLLDGRTAFIIAHRLTTVLNADLAIVLDGGRVVETGPPQHLLRGNSRFAELARAQSLLSSQVLPPTPAARAGARRPRTGTQRSVT
jgi:ATP-binding cassette subfamily B protein/subfamily B ATP-binding cassette protein MsbA